MPCAQHDDVSATAGMAMGDEAQSVDIFEELCDICRRQGLLQDTPPGLRQNAQQQLGDLAELMRSYGFPTPGWGDEEDAEGPDGAADMAVDQVCLPTCLNFKLPDRTLKYLVHCLHVILLLFFSASFCGLTTCA